MKVEIVKPIQGAAYFQGDLVETSDEKGRAWCESGHAIPSKEETEKAVSKVKSEKAVK
jgi:hypothetical protein